jgi:hypothetical protein
MRYTRLNGNAYRKIYEQVERYILNLGADLKVLNLRG